VFFAILIGSFSLSGAAPHMQGKSVLITTLEKQLLIAIFSDTASLWRSCQAT
jgi:hypothetical protein